MSRIRSKNTKPELVVRKYLFTKGYRYRLHTKTLPGKPDIVLSKYRTVIFIHGCFWHGHSGCRYYTLPKTRTKWWTDKIRSNINKDEESLAALKQQGWKVIIIWECELRSDVIREKKIASLLNELNTTNE